MSAPGELASRADSRRASWRRRGLAVLALLMALGAAGWWAWSWQRASALRESVRSSARRGRWDEAEAALANLDWYRPGDADALGLRARIALARGDRRAAIGWLQRIPERAPGASASQRLLGQLLLGQFRAREAEAAFRACLAGDPADVEARRSLIVILGIQRRGPEQAAELWALHDLGGHELEALRLLAHAAPVIPPDGLGGATDEGQILERCLAADPDDPHARPALARFERGRGRVDAALRWLEPWLARHPDDPSATLERLECLVEAGEDDRAGPDLERTDGPATSLAGFWSLRGEWLLTRPGREQDALESLRRAVRIDPRDPTARYRLARAIKAAGFPDEAEAALRWVEDSRALIALMGVLPESSPDPAALVRAGRLCRSMGRDREARAWMAEALRRDPSNREARAALGEIPG